jgi:hypothetical protein
MAKTISKELTTMSNKADKKFRRGIRKRVNDMSMFALKKEIFRLARNRDVLGVLLVIESLIALIFIVGTVLR